MLTGRDIDLYWSQRSDVAYSGYLDNAKKNRLFRNTMFVATNNKYLTLDEQKTFDELAALITTEVVKKVNNNKIFTSPIAISNVTFNGAQAIITTQFEHNLLFGDTVIFDLIQGITTTPAINGTNFIVNAIVDKFTFAVPVTSFVGTYTANTGQVVHSKLIDDYMHLYSVKCKYIEPQFFPVNSTMGYSPINVYFKQATKFRDGSMIQLQAMNDTPAANGTWYYKALSKGAGRLYYDADFQLASVGGVDYPFPQGTVNYVWYESAKPKFSDRDIDPFEEASVEMPQYEISDKFLKFFPSNRVCDEITISYVKKPSVFIDVTDNSLDLSLFYPEKYLYFIIDVAIRLFSTPLRDTLLTQEINNEIAQNP